MASFSSFENLQKDSINNASTKLMAEGKDKKKNHLVYCEKSVCT